MQKNTWPNRAVWTDPGSCAHGKLPMYSVNARDHFNCSLLLSPSYLSNMCQPVSVNPSRRCLRSAARGDLVVPATWTVSYGPRSFAVAGPATWNSLPASLRWPTVSPVDNVNYSPVSHHQWSSPVLSQWYIMMRRLRACDWLMMDYIHRHTEI